MLTPLYNYLLFNIIPPVTECARDADGECEKSLVKKRRKGKTERNLGLSRPFHNVKKKL